MSLEDLARTILAERNRKDEWNGAPSEGIGEFIQRMSQGKYQWPRHLELFIRVLEEARTRPIRMVVSAPPRHGKPLGKDTLVTMADGTQRPIGSLRVGDRVVSGAGRVTSVTAVYDQGELDVFRVRTRGGREFLADGTHRFLTPTGWFRVEELAIGWALLEVDRTPDVIVSIEPAGREHCFCITVEHDASFLAEGLITHNSESVRHALAWHILHDPRKMHAYVTYASGFSRFGSRKVRTICQDAGVRFVDGKPGALNQWLTKEGGGLIAEGVNGQLTGKGVDGLFIIDDPIKNRIEAESPILRERIWDFFTDAAFTRLEKNASVIVIMTRWHPDDLAGRLIKSGWGYLNLQAMSADGPLWPDMFTAEKLEEIKNQVGEYTWSSLYMGMPTPRGGQLFRDVLTYDPNATVVRSGTWRLAIGIDLAYTAKTKADYSVAVVMATVEDGRCFVLDVVREQMEAPAFCEKLKDLRRKYPAPIRWYASGTESGSAQFLRAQGLPIEVLPPLGDKFVRAQNVSAAWNSGRVLIPKAAPWAGAFADEVLSFTGVRDAHDDQVDAMASAFDLLYPAVKPAKAQVMSGLDIMRR
jgi:predicted phage terminase large subunit-like protein